MGEREKVIDVAHLAGHSKKGNEPKGNRTRRVAHGRD